MAIQEQLEQLTEDVEQSYEKLEEKGATIPMNKNTDNLADAIDSIVVRPEPTGTVNITSNGDYDVKAKATAHVDVPGAPSGSIDITENGDGIDVAQYATANVNVSGSGGVEDKEFIQLVNGTAVSFGSDSTTVVTPPSGTPLKDLELAFTYTGVNGTRAGFPKDTVSVTMYSPPKNSADYYSAFHANGYAQGTIRVGSQDITLKTPSPLYNSSPTHSLTGNGIVKIDYVYAEFDFANAIEGPATVVKPCYQQRTSSINVSGKLYFIPVTVTDPVILQSQQGVEKTSQDFAFMNYPSTGSKIDSPTSGSTIDAATGNFNGAYRMQPSASDRDNYAQNYIATEPYSIYNFASSYPALKTGFWVGVIILGSHTLQEYINEIQDTTKYPYGHQPFMRVYKPGTTSAFEYKMISDQDIAKVKQELAENPDSINFKASTDNIAGNVRPVGGNSLYLHEFLDNIRLGRIGIRNEETWSTDYHTGIYGTNDDTDLSNVDELTNGGYY